VGLGAIYPDFKEDNPSKIVSGFGGTLNLLVSLVFVITVLLVQSIPTFQYWIKGDTFLLSQILVSVISLLFTIIPLRLGTRAINALEV
jgi:ABC-2 type transport system permease protein